MDSEDGHDVCFILDTSDKLASFVQGLQRAGDPSNVLVTVKPLRGRALTLALHKCTSHSKTSCWICGITPHGSGTRSFKPDVAILNLSQCNSRVYGLQSPGKDEATGIQVCCTQVTPGYAIQVRAQLSTTIGYINAPPRPCLSEPFALCSTQLYSSFFLALIQFNTQTASLVSAYFRCCCPIHSAARQLRLRLCSLACIRNQLAHGTCWLALAGAESNLRCLPSMLCFWPSAASSLSHA